MKEYNYLNLFINTKITSPHEMIRAVAWGLHNYIETIFAVEYRQLLHFLLFDRVLN